jgi:hypothetical protein
MISEPKDTGNIAYIIFFWLGLGIGFFKIRLSTHAYFFLSLIGNLFPWNAFITAATYFSERFCG